jgi:hypothetical protein
MIRDPSLGQAHFPGKDIEGKVKALLVENGPRLLQNHVPGDLPLCRFFQNKIIFLFFEFA